MLPDVKALHIYTVIIFETDEPVIETNWTSYPAAVSFAQKIFLRSKVWCVQIWNGYPPEDLDADLREHDDLLFRLWRGVEVMVLDLGELGKLLYPPEVNPEL